MSNTVLTLRVDGVTIRRITTPEAIIVGSTTPGPVGPQGAQGAQGVGIATGGTTNQFLVKNSGTNFDTAWSSALVADSANVTAANASSVPVTVNGVASQTANLTEWKNSSGGVLAALNPIGMMQFSGASAFVVALYADAGGPSVGWGTSSSFDHYGRMDVSSGMLRILGANDGLLVTRSTNGVVERVRGVSGQTSDLQQWQNSSGTVLARVTSDGEVRAALIDGGSA